MNKLKSVLIKMAASAVLAVAPLVALGGVSYADGSVSWTGQGVSNGQFDTVQCSGDTPNPGDVLWVFTATGADSATISIDSGAAATMTQEGNGAFHFVQTGFNGDFGSLSATAMFSGDTNSGNPQLVISHGCPATGGEGGGPQMDCDNDTDNSPQSECTTPPQPQKDCDNDFDSSPVSECATPGQVLGANTTTPGQGAGPAQVAVVPQGSINGGEGAASSSLSKASAIGLFSSLLSAGAGLALFNRRQG